MKAGIYLFLLLIGFEAFAQNHPGVLTGSVLDEKSKALEGSTIELISLKDSLPSRTVLSDKNGTFLISNIPFGYYRLKLSFIGRRQITLDSIFIRPERFDFNLNDLVLHPASPGSMAEVIVYLEKPLIESKEGNITFNAGESALSAGSNASELLTSVPLVTKDADGKLLVRGKEPKILIDDKPVELNLQQLQDLLEAMPGSSVEKIEVMTNPPPQYASEQGGVINIVTKKGAVGINGRLSLYAGSRGEAGVNGSFNYRKQGFSLNINAGTGFNHFEGDGYSRRQNIYDDSSNFFNTESQYENRNIRPNFRANINYDPTKQHAFNLALQYNGNDFENTNITEYRNLNKFSETYRLSERTIRSSGQSYNPNISLSYTYRTKKPGESLRLITNLNYSESLNDRDFYQQFFYPDGTANGSDSTQSQVTGNRTRGNSIRVNYEKPFSNKKTFLSLGSHYTISRSDIEVDANYLRKTDGTWVPLDALTNHFTFRQYISNFRASIKQVWKENFSSSIGLNAEQTNIRFDLYKMNTDTSNGYWSFLPFATINRNWKEKLHLTLSYRKTIRRPGINEMNPTVDFGDPYNIRFGNPGLLASPAHNFDLVIGKNKNSFFANISLGYNVVEDIFAQVRTLQPDGKTQITWENISGRNEYEISTWSGYTVSKQLKINLSGSYTYNEYSSFDKMFRKYRNGGSFTSNLNANYTIRDLYTATGNFTFNRFANPQGSVRSNLRMNIGLQAKMLKKKLTATLNIIDPFVQQQNRSQTIGTNFILESASYTQTRNFRISLGYTFSKNQKKPAAKNRREVDRAVQKVKSNG